VPFSKRFLVYCKNNMVIGFGVGSDVTILGKGIEKRKQLIEQSDIIYYVSKTDIENYNKKVNARTQHKDYIIKNRVDDFQKYSKMYNTYIEKMIPVFIKACEKMEDELLLEMKSEINRLTEQKQDGYHVRMVLEQISYKIGKIISLKIKCKDGSFDNKKDIDSFSKFIENIKDFVKKYGLDFNKITMLKKKLIENGDYVCGAL